MNSDNNKICMSKNDVFVYTFLLTIIFLFLVYVIYSQMQEQKNNVIIRETQLYEQKENEAKESNEQNQQTNQQIPKQIEQTQFVTSPPQIQAQAQAPSPVNFVELDQCNLNLSNTKMELNQQRLLESNCQREVFLLKQAMTKDANLQNLLNKIYNPTASPDRYYTNSSNYGNQNYQLIGYVYNSEDRFPLYGRYKDPNRTDRWEYYVIDESKNKLKIPFETRNNIELYNGDTIEIPTLGTDFNVRLYKYEEIRYIPTV